jgi:hydroxyacylglutathione hydrolase
VIFRQFIHDDLGCASYMVGDEKAGVVAVIDPRFEIDDYLKQARYLGVSIDHILETHNHADHVSGHGRLAAATGAPIYVHEDADVDYDAIPIREGIEIELGNVTIRAMHTPGHRPEHTAFLLIDCSRSVHPWAVLTGDSLFINDVARPDLAIEPREGAETIHRSLQEKLLQLPANCEVWPGHLGGSMCGGPGMDMKICSTIGFELENNPGLSVENPADFIEQSLAKIGPQPPNFEAIVAINRGPLRTESVEVLSLTPRQLEQKRADGALIVDVRTDHQFDDAHIAGSICIPLMRAGFGSKLAWIADHDQEIAFVGRDDDDGRRAARLATAVGLTNLAGFLGGGNTSWLQEGYEVERIERVSVSALLERGPEPDTQILDVRERSEFETGHIPNAVSVPWHDIEGIPAGIDQSRPLAVICGSGERAAVAASLIKREGAARPLHVVEGGVPRWRELGGPIESEEAAGDA